jgi:fucose permease
VAKRDRDRRLLPAIGCLGFVGLGLPDGLLGVAWPSIRGSFALPLDALGALLVATTAGYVTSSFGSGWILARINVGALLAASCLATAVSLFGYAVAPGWWVMVLLGSLAGLGAGAIDAGLNAWVATHYGARTLNWLHACYGLGAASGPVLMTSVLMGGLPWQSGYAILAGGQLALAFCFAATRSRWPAAAGAAGAGPAAAGAPSVRSTLRLPAAWLGIAAFLLYTGLEAATGAWAYSLLTGARGVSMMTAGNWVSLYWGALMLGRIAFGFAAGLAPVPQLLRGCIACAALGAGLIAFGPSDGICFAGLALLGLASGPIFPSLIAATPARLGASHAANGVGFQVAAAALGQSLLPAGVGALAARLGLESLGPALLGTALLLLVVHELLCAAAPAAPVPLRHGAPLPGIEAP